MSEVKEVVEVGNGCGYKKATGGILVVMELFCILTINIHILDVKYSTIVLQDVTIGGNWVKGTVFISYNCR